MRTNRSRPGRESQRLSLRNKLDRSLNSTSSTSDAGQEVTIVRDEDESGADQRESSTIVSNFLYPA